MRKTFFNRVLFLFVVVFSFNSCITNKNLEYINTLDNSVSSTSYNYVVQKEDLLSVQISSTTKSDYDFFNLHDLYYPFRSLNIYQLDILCNGESLETLLQILEDHRFL